MLDNEGVRREKTSAEWKKTPKWMSQVPGGGEVSQAEIDPQLS